MAWYAEMVRTRKPWLWYQSMIDWYSNKLYQEWYDSLSPEEIERLKEKKRRREEREKEELDRAMHHLMMMPLMIADIYGRRLMR